MMKLILPEHLSLIIVGPQQLESFFGYCLYYFELV